MSKPQSPGHPDNQAPLPSFRLLSEWQDAPLPLPMIWHDPGGNRAPWPLVSIGEPGIISAPGGSGKSYLALAIARAAVTDGNALGLHVREAGVLIVSYEDSPHRLAYRMGNVPENVHVLPDPGPLVEVGPDGAYQGSATWRTLKSNCEGAALPPLVIIDPVGAIFDDIEASNSSAVRWLLQGLSELPAGVLLIAHDTKQARNAARAGDDPGAGAVAGSGAWHDRARSVAYLRSGPRGCEFRILETIKANHGPTGWGVAMRPDKNEWGDFRGFLPGGIIQPQDMDEAIKSLRGGKLLGDVAGTIRGNPNADLAAGDGEGERWC